MGSVAVQFALEFLVLTVHFNPLSIKVNSVYVIFL